jgi:hypothetical protein
MEVDLEQKKDQAILALADSMIFFIPANEEKQGAIECA